jgi:hypothetical protein
MIKIVTPGTPRLANWMIINIGISIIAEKYNLKVDNYIWRDQMDELGIKLFDGGLELPITSHLYDNDILPYLIQDDSKLDFGFTFDGHFQMKEFVLKYRTKIQNHFNQITRMNNDSMFVHVRLGDVAHKNPGLNFYETAIKRCKYDVGYISSDDLNHKLVNQLVDKFSLIKYDNSPINTLKFGASCDNLVLSHGTYSWCMGMMSDSNNIMFPTIKSPWHGDIFVYDDWKEINYE